MNAGQIVTINSRKYDQSIRRSWTAGLVARETDLLIFEGVFDRDVDHPDLGLIKCGTISREYYWLDRWYNIFRFHEPEGTLRNYYCNVNMPPVFVGRSLDYVDLDIDVVVWPDGRYEVLDEAEFEGNARKFAYPDAVRRKAADAVGELIALIESDELPK
jgi:protein associated with RNAse G/E